jgi:hypothetical protein
MRFSLGQSATNRLGNWLLPALFAALATAAFIRPHAIRAIHRGIDGTLRHIADVEIYSRTVIASNYFNDGFVRRGLGGTIAVLLSDDWDRSIWLFIAVSLLLLIVPLVLIMRRLAERLGTSQTIYLGLILALSPQSFFGWAHDPSRTDLLVGACLAFSMLAWLGGHKATAVAAILAGLLAHETAVVYGLPLLAAMALTDLRAGTLDRREAMRLALAACLGVAAIILLQMAFSVPPQVTARNMLDQAPMVAGDPERLLWRDIAIYMAVGGSRALRTALCYNLQVSSRYWPEVFGCLAVLAAYAFILPLRRHLVAAALVMWVPAIFMMLIANDTGRWLKLAVLDGWLIASFLLLRGEAAAQLSPRAMGLGAVLFLALLAMGPTRHNNVNRAYGHLLLRLGYEDHVALDVWMNSCDPGWRRYVYGGSTGGPAASVK